MMQILGGGGIALYQRGAMVRLSCARRQRLSLGKADAETIHAGVDVDCGQAGITIHLAEGVPLGKLAEIADYRPAIELREDRACTSEIAVEHIDRGGRCRRPCASRL